jgi:hypothetical protein
MFKSISPGRSSLALPDLDLIAKETHLVTRRSSKFSPAGFLQTLLGSVVTELDSFNQLAAFDPDPRHVRRDKRRRESPVESGIKSLT